MFGYFVVRPWQSHRKLESMRVEGIAAANEGDIAQATKLLGGYLNRAQDPDPELYLTFARARLRFQASDGGHIRVAIQAYRTYLDDVPDDVEASQELLPLFNSMGMFVEAKTLAEKLRTKLNDPSIKVLRQEIHAREGLNDDDAAIEPLFVMSMEHPDVQFTDMYQYIEWLRKHDRFDEAQSLIADRIQAGHNEVDTQLAALWVRVSKQTTIRDQEVIAGYVEELTAILGLDPETGQWIAEPEYLTPEMASFVDRLLNNFRRSDLSLPVRLASARLVHDRESMRWAARRLYWDQDYETLWSMGLVDSEGDTIPDVLGYQILAYQKTKNEEKASSTLKQLQGLVLDFRASAWNSYFAGVKLLDGDQIVQARPKIKLARDMYPSEPTFHLAMGDVYARQGGLGKGKDEWLTAQSLVLDVVGNVRWIDPPLRIVNAYTRAGRLSEVIDSVNALVTLAPQNPVSMVVWLKSYSSLASTNDIDRSMIERILSNFKNTEGELSPQLQAIISPSIATLYASIGRNDEAREVIRDGISASSDENQVLALLEVDQRFSLGVGESGELDMGQLALSSPQNALRYALNLYAQSNDIEAGLATLDRGAQQAGAEDAYPWALARVGYLDAVDDRRASEAWTTLRHAHPDDIDLLYRMAESKAMSKDLDTVNELIDTIVTKTSTEGEPLSSRLRLARASAIIGSSPTRASRDLAIEIVRAVVADEQQNIKAREMLANLLAMHPSPTLDPKDSFSPNIKGAIDQYVAISRQINGRSAQKYLLRAVDLSFEGNDDESAKRFLLELGSRFPDDNTMQLQVADRLMNLGDLQNAGATYSKVFNSSVDSHQRINAGLSLTKVWSMQNKGPQVAAMLNNLRNEPAMNEDQLTRLATLYAKSGYKPEGDELAINGERYGLSPIQAKMVYAQYANAFISKEVSESTLKEAIELDPTYEPAWIMLIRRLVRDRQFDQAQTLVAQATSELPESNDLKALAILAKGDVDSASMLLESGTIGSNKLVAQAVKRVDAYMASKEKSSNDEQIALLTSMLDDFTNFEPVQRFALSELATMKIDPGRLASYADRAGRFSPGDSDIMRIAARAYLQAGNPVDALRISKLWHANASGYPIEPDLASAQALIELDNFASASQTLEPYVLGAIDSPEKPVSAQVLYAYSHAQLKQGEGPRITAARLEPLLAKKENTLARQVWLNLSTGSVPTEPEAARWLTTITPLATPEEMPSIANAWLVMMDRFKAWVPAYAQSAISILEPIAQAHPDNPNDLAALARAYNAMSKAVEDEAIRASNLQRAISLMDQADELDPTNLAYLAQGASYATRARDYAAGEARYRRLLDRGLAPSPFSATIKNNLALLIELQTHDPDQLAEALQLSTDATTLVDSPSFWGTRGWVELASNKLPEAEESFQHAIDQDSSDLEGWVGLAIVQRALGETRADDAASSFKQVKTLIQSDPISADLLDRIRKQGDPAWISALNP